MHRYALPALALAMMLAHWKLGISPLGFSTGA
jgi:hypothetical protein